MAKKLAKKIVIGKAVRRTSIRRTAFVPSEKQFIAELRWKYGTGVVDEALKDQNLDIPLSRIGLIYSVQRITRKNGPRLAKDMKQGPRKDIRR